MDLDQHSVLLVLSEAEMTAAQLDAVDTGNMPILLHTLAIDQEIPGHALATASILVLEISPNRPESLERLSAVREIYPQLPVIVAVREPNLPLVRTLLKQGVRDVVGLPLPHAELVEILKEIAAELQAELSSDVRQGQLITIMNSSKNGKSMDCMVWVMARSIGIEGVVLTRKVNRAKAPVIAISMNWNK